MDMLTYLVQGRKDGWNINLLKLAERVVEIFVVYLIIPLLFYAMFTDYQIILHDDAFLAVFLTLFVIKIGYRLWYPPTYKIVKQSAITKEGVV